MSPPALVVFAAGAAVIAAAAYRLAALHDDTRADRRKLARLAWREVMRQESELHPVARPDWQPYRSNDRPWTWAERVQ